MDCVNAAARTARTVFSRAGFPIPKHPRVTQALIAVNVLMFLYGLTQPGSSWSYRWALAPDFWTSEPWRVVTSAFVHFGLLHIAMNMLVLYQFGTQLEKLLGTARFVLLYFVSALGASVLVILLGGEGTIHGGASGAIFGLIAAYIVTARAFYIPAQSIMAQAGIWLVLGFFLGLSWQGHLGGAITGAAVMWLLLKYSTRRTKPTAPPQAGW